MADLRKSHRLVKTKADDDAPGVIVQGRIAYNSLDAVAVADVDRSAVARALVFGPRHLGADESIAVEIAGQRDTVAVSDAKRSALRNSPSANIIYGPGK